jgi:hypothetical protein
LQSSKLLVDENNGPAPALAVKKEKKNFFPKQNTSRPGQRIKGAAHDIVEGASEDTGALIGYF